VLCFNAHHEPIEFALPPRDFGPAWIPIVDIAADANSVGKGGPIAAGITMKIDGRAMTLLQATLAMPASRAQEGRFDKHTAHASQTLSSRGKRIS
jgi:hypothetical protein